MRAVVNDHNSQAPGGFPIDPPLRPAAIDGSVSMLVSNHERNLISSQAAFVDTHFSVSGPIEPVEGGGMPGFGWI
jgi:hypothetical protein